MTEPIIQFQNVTKTYRLYTSHVDRVKEAFHPFRKVYHHHFDAINDLSFEIFKGETIGIVGRNGSGKSTLLQLVCSILQPTAGSIRVDGRISALLELGTGFNPEFTGRENVYLNAAILGLHKEEIDSCFKDIEEFAQIGDFIDQPVKMYSSGMYVRLAFAVAINVNPDILIVDEALAVGDAVFQAKCFAKFREFQEKGVTIVFVTHATDLITQYCTRALLLDSGVLQMTGGPKEVVDEYSRLLAGVPSRNDQPFSAAQKETAAVIDDHLEKKWQGLFVTNPLENRYGNGKATVIEGGIFSPDGKAAQTIIRGQSCEIRIRVVFNETVRDPVFAFTVKDIKGFNMTGTNTRYQKLPTGSYEKDDIVEVVFSQSVPLNAGNYLISFGCAGFEEGEYVVYDRRYDYMGFEVVSETPSVGYFDLGSKITINK